jgi:hypothetical protein
MHTACYDPGCHRDLNGVNVRWECVNCSSEGKQKQQKQRTEQNEALNGGHVRWSQATATKTADRTERSKANLHV